MIYQSLEGKDVLFSFGKSVCVKCARLEEL